jgi:hypothetical protein
MKLFRELTVNEAKEFRQWARENYLPEAMEIKPIWHPVTQAECYLMIAEEYILKPASNG